MSTKDETNMQELDGSLHEGGGQMIRISIGLCALLQKSVKLFNIRAGRTKPGLKAQHMSGLQIVHQMMGGPERCQLQGCVLNSKEVTFQFLPQQANSQNSNNTTAPAASNIKDHKEEKFSIDIQTAGATTLISQLAVPVALFRPSKSILLDLKGGTDVDFAPTVEYYQAIFGAILHRFIEDEEGANNSNSTTSSFGCQILKRGYFPKGGGQIQLTTKPLTKPLKAVTLTDPGNVEAITIFSSSAGKVPREVAMRMATSARQHLVTQGLRQESIEIVTQYFDSKQAFGNGSAIFIKAKTTTGCVLGSSALGSPKISPEKSGQKAAQSLFEYIEQGICLDEYAQDQVIIFMALAKGCSKFLTGPLTLHTQTAIYVVEQFTDARYKIHPVSEVTNIIECEGIGLEPPNFKKL
jgi:RNA 3'-terminal phosphate cyclase (ATP)